MRLLSTLVLLTTLIACGDPDAATPSGVSEASDPTPVEETSDVSAESSAPECMAIAADLAENQYGGAVEPVDAHTVPFGTAALNGEGCFLTFYRNVTAPMLAPGEDFPYPYSYVVTGERMTVELETPDDLPALTLAAVGFDDVDGNGEMDIFLTHDEGRAFAFLSEGEQGLEQWFFEEPDGQPYATVSEVKSYYREAYNGGGTREPETGGDPLATLTVRNSTGMNLIFLHIAGCTESEGEDWADMASWATDYLGDEILEADGSVDLEFVPGCYVLHPVWEDDTEATERIELTGDMVHDLILG
ncbi:MAG TPA: hypothetical protein EYQ24_03105 [Bacteroidetes bacterium]|nr:hypothetical protein [Bacteroidota bacterium]HIL57543.1 hypothetical protein [Rhodothermales bacterium]